MRERAALSHVVIVSGSAGRMSPSTYSTWLLPRICYVRCLRDMGAPLSRVMFLSLLVDENLFFAYASFVTAIDSFISNTTLF